MPVSLQRLIILRICSDVAEGMAIKAS